jgi:hypothetical protein
MITSGFSRRLFSVLLFPLSAYAFAPYQSHPGGLPDWMASPYSRQFAPAPAYRWRAMPNRNTQRPGFDGWRMRPGRLFPVKAENQRYVRRYGFHNYPPVHRGAYRWRPLGARQMAHARPGFPGRTQRLIWDPMKKGYFLPPVESARQGWGMAEQRPFPVSPARLSSFRPVAWKQFSGNRGSHHFRPLNDSNRNRVAYSYPAFPNSKPVPPPFLAGAGYAYPGSRYSGPSYRWRPVSGISDGRAWVANSGTRQRAALAGSRDRYYSFRPLAGDGRRTGSVVDSEKYQEKFRNGNQGFEDHRFVLHSGKQEQKMKRRLPKVNRYDGKADSEGAWYRDLGV